MGKRFQDNTAASKLLGKALGFLESVYAKKGGAALIQVKATKQPDGFEAYEKNSSSNSVIDLITKVKRDADEAVKDDTQAEEEAQFDYETTVKSLNRSIAKKKSAKA